MIIVGYYKYFFPVFDTIVANDINDKTYAVLYVLA